jgi:hypothetical protein
MKLPFGKHRGLSLEQVPESYLRWVVDWCNYATSALKNVIRRRLQGTVRPPEQPPSDLSDRVQRWYAELCLTHSPDRGGSAEVMQAIDDAHVGLPVLLNDVLNAPKGRVGEMPGGKEK